MKIVLAAAALAELQDAAIYYSTQGNTALGKAFLVEFENAANKILKNPLLGKIFYKTRRRYLFHKFPYSLIYQVTAKEIRILAVAHHRRFPGYWQNR